MNSVCVPGITKWLSLFVAGETWKDIRILCCEILQAAAPHCPFQAQRTDFYRWCDVHRFEAWNWALPWDVNSEEENMSIVDVDRKRKGRRKVDREPTLQRQSFFPFLLTFKWQFCLRRRHLGISWSFGCAITLSYGSPCFPRGNFGLALGPSSHRKWDFCRTSISPPFLAPHCKSSAIQTKQKMHRKQFEDICRVPRKI